MTTRSCFELRVYEAHPGRLDDLEARFRDHTMALFARHGLHVVAFFRDLPPGDDETLTYLLSFESREDARRAWDDFHADPEWIAAKAATEANGPLTLKVRSTFLTPTDFSPAIS